MARLSALAWPTLVRLGYARAFDRGAAATGIVHLGTGAFFRAHAAVYTDAVLASGDLRWGITGISLRHRDVRDALAPQDGLYTVLVRDNESVAAQVIGSLTRVLAAPFEPLAVRRALCDPASVIVTLTITEKAYGMAADGNLDFASPAIAADLQNPHAPATAVGWLAHTLIERRECNLAPYTVLACDNLRDNGRTLRRLVLQYTQRAFPAAAGWMADAVTFPNSVVDRIVPRTVAVDARDARAAHGFDDVAPVRCEPFTQWVVEKFAGPQPQWEIAGVQFVPDVRPFEDAKLRLLNAAHTAFACFGVLLGHATIAQAAADMDLAAFVRALMTEELAPTLERSAALDPLGYQASLWPRFANAALGHATHQVAMDTSAKLTQRHLPAIRARRANGESIERLALVVAGWMRYLAGVDENGAAYSIDDPLATTLAAIATTWRADARACVERMFRVEAVFGDLCGDTVLKRAAAAHLKRIARVGVRASLRAAT